MRLLLFTLWSLAAWAQPRAITLTKEVPGGVVNLGTVATPTVDNDTGAYELPVTLTFSDATVGAAIWTCSNTGSDCTPSALTNPVTVSVTDTHVCAVAKKTDYTDSARKCATITVPAANITYVNSADLGNNGGGTSSHTASYTVGSGTNRLLVLAVVGDTATDYTPTATYNGVSMTLHATKSPTTHTRYGYLFYLLNPASGTHDVVVTMTGTTYILAGVAEYAGVRQTGQPDSSTTGSGTTSPQTVTLTTVADNSWGIMMALSDGVESAGTGSTLRVSDAAFGTWVLFDSGGALTPAGSHSMTWNASAVNNLESIVVAFKP